MGGMNSSFSVSRSALKWDPDSWRHYPDSAGDARFLEELQRLRSPPSNLDERKYMECIAQGIRRQTRAGFSISHENSRQFWDMVNAKPFQGFQRDRVETTLRALNAMPSSASPMGAVTWGTHVRNALDKAQRGRAFFTLPGEIDLWFSALKPWTRVGNALAEQPDLTGTPPWVQKYGIFLRDFEAMGSTVESATQDFLVQLHNETSQQALNIAQRFSRSDMVNTHPAFHEAALQMLVMLSDAPRLSETAALFVLGSTLLGASSASNARLVSALQSLVPNIPSRSQPFLLATFSSHWDCEDLQKLWSHFPVGMRREQASLVLDRACKTGFYQGLEADDARTWGAPFIGLSDTGWEAIEKEIGALRPWPLERMRDVALNIPDTQWGLRLATALDPSVEIIHALVGDSWQDTWLQRLDTPVLAHEVIEGNIFETNADM